MKTCLITGVSRGIGRATAEVFLANDWHVIGSSISGANDWQHPELEILALDLEETSSINAFTDAVQSRGHQLDALINCAGVNYGLDDEPLSIEKLRSTIEINLIGTISLSEQLLNSVVNEGIIVNITSTAGLLRPIPVHITPYRISKAGLNIYTQVLAERLQPRDITVVAYNPGWIRTEMGTSGATKLPSQVAEELLAMVTIPPQSGTFWDETKLVAWQ